MVIVLRVLVIVVGGTLAGCRRSPPAVERGHPASAPPTATSPQREPLASPPSSRPETKPLVFYRSGGEYIRERDALVASGRVAELDAWTATLDVYGISARAILLFARKPEVYADLSARWVELLHAQRSARDPAVLEHFDAAAFAGADGALVIAERFLKDRAGWKAHSAFDTDEGPDRSPAFRSVALAAQALGRLPGEPIAAAALTESVWDESAADGLVGKSLEAHADVAIAERLEARAAKLVPSRSAVAILALAKRLRTIAARR